MSTQVDDQMRQVGTWLVSLESYESAFIASQQTFGRATENLEGVDLRVVRILLEGRLRFGDLCSQLRTSLKRLSELYRQAWQQIEKRKVVALQGEKGSYSELLCNPSTSHMGWEEALEHLHLEVENKAFCASGTYAFSAWQLSEIATFLRTFSACSLSAILKACPIDPEVAAGKGGVARRCVRQLVE